MVTDVILPPFTKSLLDMSAREKLPDLSQITQLTITTETEILHLVSKMADDSDDTDGYTWYLQDEQGDSPVSQDAIDSLLVYLKNLSWTGCADFHMQDAATYGLDVPAATYEISYTTDDGEATLTLLVGDGNENGVFVKPADSVQVYLVDKTAGSVLAQMSKETLYGTDMVS